MDLNLMPALESLSVKVQEFFKIPEANEDSNRKDGDGPVERQGGGNYLDIAHADAKRCRGASGSHKASGLKNEALENIEDCMRSLMMSQMREPPTVHVEEGIMTLFRGCLVSNLKDVSFVVAKGNIEHYQSKKDVDIGWGCGWRNIQVLASYLISEDAEVRETLFGGAGYVPDIPALQQWLEIAWAKGFDVPGGEIFDWKITGTHKWIGTTEGAALLRSFGVRVRIVDFQATGSKREQQNGLRSKTGTEETHIERGGEESSNGNDDGEANEPRRAVMDNVNLVCIVCGEHILEDSEFGLANDNPDMCPVCMKRLEHSGNTSKENFIDECETQITGRHRHGWDDKSGVQGCNNGQTTVKHQQMVEWVWKYFMSDTVESDTSSSLRLSNCSPLYFQYRGHSQTIVGIERRKVSTPPDVEELNLLVLDPSEETVDIVDSLRKNRGWTRLLKRGLQTLKQQEYQLCYAERGVAKGKEYENLKILTSRSYTY